MKRALLPLVLVGALFALAFGVSIAAADQTNNGFRITLFGCSPGPSTYEAISGPGIGIGGLNIVGSNLHYVIESQSWTDADGFHQITIGKATANRQLVSCHYIGPISGNDYTNLGFFTPVGP